MSGAEVPLAIIRSPFDCEHSSSSRCNKKKKGHGARVARTKWTGSPWRVKTFDFFEKLRNTTVELQRGLSRDRQRERGDRGRGKRVYVHTYLRVRSAGTGSRIPTLLLFGALFHLGEKSTLLRPIPRDPPPGNKPGQKKE